MAELFVVPWSFSAWTVYQIMTPEKGLSEMKNMMILVFLNKIPTM